jgi:hypothetical protein
MSGYPERRWILWYRLPSLYVIAGTAVKEDMTGGENGGVRGVVHAKNAAGTNQS